MTAPEDGPRKRSGFETVLIIAIVAGVGFFVVAGVGAWLFFQSEQGRKVLEGASAGYEMFVEGQRAPGAEELRGLGCTQAIIFELSKFAEIAASFEEEAGEADDASLDRTLVMCQVEGLTSPSCDQVAATYVAAAAPEREFMVVVEATGRECSVHYAADGSSLGEFDLDAEATAEE